MSEENEYTSISFQVFIYVVIGIAVAVWFDSYGYFGFFSEGIVRAIAGSADTLGLTIAGFITIISNKVRQNKSKVPTAWIVGGLIGIVISFGLQAMVFKFAEEPRGLAGVIYAFGFSNLDNTLAGLSVLIATVVNQGSDGWNNYWRHPFYLGNAIMLVIIPICAFLFRLISGFITSNNTAAGIEAGIMDVDSIGAALIFLVLTKFFKVKVPKITDDSSYIIDAVSRRLKISN